MSSVVLDASALLVLLNNEPGAEYVERAVVESGAVVSVVNWAEVLTKGVEAGKSPRASGNTSRARPSSACASRSSR